MKYVSIDIETTGTNWNMHQVLEFGAVLEDTSNILPLEELPRFHAMIKHPVITGEPYALQMNHRIIKELAMPTGEVMILDAYSLAMEFKKWCLDNGLTYAGKSKKRVGVIPAGKNFSGVDKNFLLSMPNFNDHFAFSHRTIDPGPLFWNPFIDEKMPDLAT